MAKEYFSGKVIESALKIDNIVSLGVLGAGILSTNPMFIGYGALSLSANYFVGNTLAQKLKEHGVINTLGTLFKNGSPKKGTLQLAKS